MGMNVGNATQLALILGSLLGQDVALESVTTFNRTTRTHAKALFSATLGFHFRHNNICLKDSSIFNMITGGSISLRLDACFHLFCNGIESAATARIAHR